MEDLKITGNSYLLYSNFLIFQIGAKSHVN